MITKRSNKEIVTITFFWIVLAVMIFYAAVNISGLKTAGNTGPVKTATEPGGQSIDYKIATYQSILKDNPDNLKALIGLGDIYFDNRRYHDAIAIFLKAEKIDPANVHIENDLGLLYLRTGRYDDALLKFKKALKVNPAHLESLYYVGVVYQHKGDNVKALQAFEQIMASDPLPQLARKTEQEIEKIKK